MSTDQGTHARSELRRVVQVLEVARKGPQRPVEHLRSLRHAQDGLDHARNLLVDAARAEGASWATIGSALGISRQAARQAKVRRDELTRQRQEAAEWRLPLPQRRTRFRWILPRRNRADRAA